MKSRRTMIYAVVLLLFAGMIGTLVTRSSETNTTQVAPTPLAIIQVATATTPLFIARGDDDTPRPDKAEVVIEAPSKVKVGDLIVLDLSKSLGAGFDYKVLPKPPGLKVFNDGQMIVCGTGSKNVEYLFIISCALNGDSDIKTHIVKVTGAKVPGPPPSPGQNLVEKVQDWAADIQSPTKRDDMLALAQSFSSIAIIIDQNTFNSASEIVDATAISNRDALGENLELWTPLLESLMGELKAMSRAGKLPDAQSHAPVWKDVAQGLRESAAEIK